MPYRTIQDPAILADFSLDEVEAVARSLATSFKDRARPSRHTIKHVSQFRHGARPAIYACAKRASKRTKR